MRLGYFPKLFFSRAERQRIEQAIVAAEKNTSAEVRVHVQSKTGSKGLFPEAACVFERMGMTKTVARNGVLIFFAIQDRAFTVIGDEGINSRVPTGFWDDVVHSMEDFFRADRFADGICTAINLIGEKLAQFFPHQPDDVNELPDVISFGK